MSNALAFLADRLGGQWELVGAALGFPRPVERVTLGLKAEQLRLRLLGLADTPDVVANRVESLAAWHTKTLASLAETWPKPIELRDNGWIEMAWRTSLRHLQRLGCIDVRDLPAFDVPIVAPEVDILWGTLPRDEMSWFDIKDLFDASIAYKGHLVRKCSRAKLVGPMPTETDLKNAHPYLARALRGNVHRLAKSTQGYLADACLRSFDVDPARTALLAELAPSTQDDLRERLIARLQTVSRPDKYVWLTYVLFTDWRVP